MLGLPVQIRPDLQGTGSAREQAQLQTAAREFEGVFLGLLLKAMRGSQPSGGLFREGSDSQMYREVFDQEVGRAMAKAGGIGLAQMILRDQARRQTAEGSSGKSGAEPAATTTE